MDTTKQADPAGKTVPAPGKPRTFKQKMVKWTLIIGVILIALFFTFRWAGSSTYRGTVQRVYEKGLDYRVEFTTLDGQVHVVGNSEIRFPYFKLDTADVHAELNRLATTHDVVDITVWGFRYSWFDMFPNVVNVKFVRSDSERLRLRAERIADAVIANLRAKGVLKGGDDVKPDLVTAIEAAIQTRETGDEQPTSGEREDVPK